MKALSLWQPWASAIALGAKRIETRGWATDYRGPLLIHAARTTVGIELVRGDVSTWDLWRRVLGLGVNDSVAGPLAALTRGALIARCELVDCVATGDTESIRAAARQTGEKYSSLERELGDYTRGRWAWLLRKVQPLAKPIPMRAYQRLFDVDYKDPVAEAG